MQSIQNTYAQFLSGKNSGHWLGLTFTFAVAAALVIGYCSYAGLPE